MFDYPEGATPIDEDEKEGLLIPHISTWEELSEWEQRNITDAYSWLDRTRRKDFLSEDFIRKLHEKMLGKVWSWAGEYRRTNKNIGVDWAQISIISLLYYVRVTAIGVGRTFYWSQLRG